MCRILALDPGNSHTGAVIVRHDLAIINIFSHTENSSLIKMIPTLEFDQVVIERVRSYGMIGGGDILDTAYMCGYYAALLRERGYPVKEYTRPEIKKRIGLKHNSNDSEVRKLIIPKYEPTGGGRIPQIGTSYKPGPLYGLTEDSWQALAAAIAYIESDDVILSNC